MSVTPVLAIRWNAAEMARTVGRGRAEVTMSFATPDSEAAAQAEADAQLIRRIAEGDQTSLAALYDRFSRPLLAVAVRILNDRAEAEDVVHDAFMTIWSKAADYDFSRGNPFTWAVVLTRNRAIDRLRSRRRRSELLDDAAPADLGLVASAEVADSSDDLWSKEKASVVRAAVSELEEDQRRALEMAFFGGLTQQEIADQLRQPLGTVKARIRRAMLKLRDHLAHRL